MLSDDDPERVIAALIKEQEQGLLRERDEYQKKLDRLNDMKRVLRDLDCFSVDSIGDIAHIIKNRKRRKRVLAFMLLLGIIMDVIEVATLVYGIVTGNWLPLIAGVPIVVALGIFISVYYFRRMEYVCPSCHEVFQPSAMSSLFAAHTPSTRRLTCPRCGKKSFCVETYREEKKS